jgi:hypothetical protein
MNKKQSRSLSFRMKSDRARRHLPHAWLALAAATAALASPLLQATSNPSSQGKDVQLRIVSSPAQYVSGGDARIEVRAAPGLHDKLQFYINGSRVDVPLHRSATDAVRLHDIQGALGRQPLVDSAKPPGDRLTDLGGNTIGYSRPDQARPPGT